jgi:hypothetical protein
MSNTQVVLLQRQFLIKLEAEIFPDRLFSLDRMEKEIGIKYYSSIYLKDNTMLPEDGILYEVDNKQKFVFAVMKYNIDYITYKK